MIENADIPGEIVCARTSIPAEAGFSILHLLSSILVGCGAAALGRCQKRWGQVGTRKGGKGRITKAKVWSQKNATPNERTRARHWEETSSAANPPSRRFPALRRHPPHPRSLGNNPRKPAPTRNRTCRK